MGKIIFVMKFSTLSLLAGAVAAVEDSRYAPEYDTKTADHCPDMEHLVNFDTPAYQAMSAACK